VTRRVERDEELAAAIELAARPDLKVFSHGWLPGAALRDYQLEPGRAIAESIRDGLGRQLAVVFSRQSGKDELLAQLLAWLLIDRAERGGTAIVAAPTRRPQVNISRDRLLDRLRRILPDGVRLRDEYIVEVGMASARFVSAHKSANVRGQTADLLLVANEAQHIDPELWDAVFDPMAASTNATTLFLGTVWDRHGLLARQMRFLEQREAEVGAKLVFKVPWPVVAEALPAYGDRVRARIAQFGEGHPFIRTEYLLEELDGEEGLFHPRRLAAMRGDHPRQRAASPGRRYALLVDVAGEDEHGGGPAAFASLARRDSTALTVVEVDEAPGRPAIYRVVDRVAWTGAKHVDLHAEIVRLAREVWMAHVVVIDATGIGAGLAGFLKKALADRRAGPAIKVDPFVFTATSKSQLGWDFLGLIDTGRYLEYREEAPPGSAEARLTEQFWAQLRAVAFDTGDGPGKTLRWSVPDRQGHDDLVMSAALVARLEPIAFRSRVAIGRSREEPSHGAA
jgi:hypothetical protein